MQITVCPCLAQALFFRLLLDPADFVFDEELSCRTFFSTSSSFSFFSKALLTAPSFSASSICFSLNSHNLFPTSSSRTSRRAQSTSRHSLTNQPPSPRWYFSSIAAYRILCAPWCGDFSTSHQNGHVRRYNSNPHKEPPVSQRRVPGVRERPGSTMMTLVQLGRPSGRL